MQNAGQAGSCGRTYADNAGLAGSCGRACCPTQPADTAISTAPPSRYFGSGQGRLRLAPAPSRRSPLLRCSASGGGGPDPALEEQRRRKAELAARISSGEFTAQGPGWVAPLAARLARLGPPGELAAGLLTKVAGGAAARRGPELPQATGSISSVVGEAFFIPLYDLFLTYGVTMLILLLAALQRGEWRAADDGSPEPTVGEPAPAEQ